MKRQSPRWLVPWLTALLMALAVQTAQARELPDFTELVDQAAPGVVNISTDRAIPFSVSVSSPWSCAKFWFALRSG